MIKVVEKLKTGQRFGRLEVISYVGLRKSRQCYLFKCDCGNTKEIIANQVLSNTVSCGCYRKELMSKKAKTHGLSNTRLFKVWGSMRERCLNNHHKRYSDYGGRGIKICPEWNDFQVFYNWAIKNGYKQGLLIDRIDNNEGYSPKNCRFVDYCVSNKNRRPFV